VVRPLCEYLAADNPQNYVPDLVINLASDTRHKPWIYTLDEVQALMDATADLSPTGSLRPRAYRTLFGLLYATGIRIGEALALNCQDFYAQERRLFIADGKFHKARWIPLAPSTCIAISDWRQQRGRYDEASTAESPLVHQPAQTPIVLQQRQSALSSIACRHWYWSF
jgi:integrase/recombinase XerD